MTCSAMDIDMDSIVQAMDPEMALNIERALTADEKRGKIAWIHVINFVVFSNTKIYPGEGLNLLTAPNGSGKSSLVAAIIIGLGGHPKILARTSELESYVKNGADAATVRVALFLGRLSGDRVQVFERTFDTNGRSSFNVDGVRSTISIYQQLVESFNVHVGNLCQFLPQDRVQDFSNMNPTELLASTLESLCPENGSRWQQLIQCRRRQTEIDSRLDTLRSNTVQKQRKNADLESIKRAIERRSAAQAKERLVSVKLVWLRLLDNRESLQVSRTDLVQCQKIVNAQKDAMRPLQDIAQAIQKSSGEQTKSIRREQQSIDKWQRQLDERLESLRKQRLTMSAKFAERDEGLRGLKAAQEEHRQAAQRIQVTLDEAEALLEGRPAQELRDEEQQLGDRLGSVEADMRPLLHRHSQLGIRLKTDVNGPLLQANKEIERLQSIGERRLEILKAASRHTYDAVLWLRNNLGLFRGVVHEPLMLILNVKPEHAKYVEMTMGRRDLLSFALEDADDVDLMHRHVRERMQLQVNLMHAPPVERLAFGPPVEMRLLRPVGFWAYCIELIEGPLSVLNVMCSIHRLHEIPVGNDATYRQTEQVPSNIRTYFSSQTRFSVRQSRYSSATSTMSSKVPGAHLLKAGIDPVAHAALQANIEQLSAQADRLRAERTSIAEQLHAIEVQAKTLNDQRGVLGALLRRYDTTLLKAERQQKQLREMPLPSSEAEFIMAQNRRMIMDWKRLISLHEGLPCVVDRVHEAVRIHAHLCGNFNSQVRDTEVVHRNLLEMHRLSSKSRDQLELIKRKITQLEQSERGARAELAALLPEGATEPNTGAPEFAELPDNETELSMMRNELLGKIDCLLDRGPEANALAEYEKREQEIVQLQRTIDEVQAEHAQLTAEMLHMHGPWYGAVQECVRSIHSKFAEYMARLGLAGEVEMQHAGDAHDYGSYGIEIRVKFRRGETVQRLDRSVQSGGERTVAIAVYSLAMQLVTVVPFRCVDEINQGMDVSNERKIFDMLVELTSTENSSQYFFVTPKLQPGLSFNGRMMVHLVHNGLYMQDDRQEDWRPMPV